MMNPTYSKEFLYFFFPYQCSSNVHLDCVEFYDIGENGQHNSQSKVVFSLSNTHAAPNFISSFY